MAVIFVQEIVRLHAYPWSIISDWDKIFTSLFWEELFEASRTQLHRSTSYHHPQADGQSKVVNRGLETYLRCFAMGKLKQWVKWVPWAEYNYNIATHFAS